MPASYSHPGDVLSDEGERHTQATDVLDIDVVQLGPQTVHLRGLVERRVDGVERDARVLAGVPGSAGTTAGRKQARYEVLDDEGTSFTQLWGWAGVGSEPPSGEGSRAVL